MNWANAAERRLQEAERAQAERRRIEAMTPDRYGARARKTAADMADAILEREAGERMTRRSAEDIHD